MQYLIFFLTIVTVLIMVKILAWPLKKIMKLLLNIFLGICIICLVNTFGGKIGISIPFNIVTALVSGLLGIPGVICLIIINYIF